MPVFGSIPNPLVSALNLLGTCSKLYKFFAF